MSENASVLILGIETSCDETGVALYDAGAARLLGHAVHSQVDMHEAYGGVVPELASRDHVRRLVPLARNLLAKAGREPADLGAVAYTEGPGLAGALLVGASFAHALAAALGVPAIGIHHLEGHLLSPLLSARAPAFPFVALLVSGGHTQLMRVEGVAGGTDEVMVGQLSNALLRDCRFLSSVGMHTGSMTQEQSYDLFRTQCYQDAGTARQQAARGTYDPGYLNYTLGKLMIRKLRDDWAATRGGHDAWKQFHDDFLSYGGPPIPLVRQQMMGEEKAKAVF